MKILVLNCGSSSIKYKLYDMTDESVLAQGGAERIGLDEAFVKVTLKDGSKEKIMHDMPSHKEGVKFVLDLLVDPKYGCLKSLDEIDAVGHRIVQGGDLFEKSCIVTPEVEKGIESLIDLAPVHNKGHLAGLRAVDALMPGTPQVTVFDNAFHSTMPPYAYLYAVPYEFYTKWHVRRYGFHGTSHRYVSQRVCEFLGVDIKTQKIITCHIGNGASVAAVKYGKVIDTSMGLTPLAGLMMGSRSGDIDPSAVTYLMQKTGMGPQEMADFLNKQSGVLGITGISSDMREIENADNEGNERAHLALQMYNYRIKKYIGAYAAAMNGVDIIVWTAGVGENQEGVRWDACSGLEYLGVKMDKERNHVRSKEQILSADDSKVKVVMIPTDEEIVIARDTRDLVEAQKK
ncbi:MULTISPECIES: acetate/propionate family kinase [Hallella]|uniref:Acetate kinase n=1 Tax=Hallella mizrahii TaxID=2606637 RepID=A0A7K0KIM8_9BACT|nr:MULTISPECIES: acetate kinase [Hallella]MST85729.1 acetate kinase [Hallella mizrahii]